jgi:beta-N-acetylhexosaminidase
MSLKGTGFSPSINRSIFTAGITPATKRNPATHTIRQAAGSLLVVGLAGYELTSLERAWLKLVRPAGIILFRRNIADAAQTRAVLHEATSLCTPQTLRCVDLEGGSVDRLRDALAPMPSAQAVYRAAQSLGKAALTREHGELIARAVRAFGFNTTLAPVLDLALPISASVMGTRVTSPDPAGVIAYARAFLQGLAAHGVVGCGKHFPGLGGGTLDSHLETPSIHRTMHELTQQDLAPYRELAGELPMIMVNHAAYPATPSRTQPASASPYWITTILRKRIGYKGIIFSDDLEMGGILKFLPIEEAVLAALRAGMDLMEICHSPELVLKAYESLIAEAERSASFRTLLLARAKQTAKKRSRFFANTTQHALSPPQLDSLRTRIQQFSNTITAAQPASEKSPA